MIKITAPPICSDEIVYIVRTVFKDILGVKYSFSVNSNGDKITHTLPNGAVLNVAVPFFKTVEEYGLLAPDHIPLKTIWYSGEFIPEEKLPVLFGSNEVRLNANAIDCDIDIYGFCFFMLSRLEECIVSERDEHGRFPAAASIANKNGFLDRPVVDEYAEMLFNMLQSLDSSLKKPDRCGSVKITCDVDYPFDPVPRSMVLTLKAVKSSLRNLNVFAVFSAIVSFSSYRLNIFRRDCYRNAIEWIMKVNEQYGNIVAFYFIPLVTSGADGVDAFDSNEVRSLLREIHRRGHLIGIHPGYKTYNKPDLFQQSVTRFRQILDEEKIEPVLMGGRQHFLMWDATVTPQLWENAGLDYDSTLSFADRAGFRCGTSHEFSLYDCIHRRELRVRERPLILMDCTIVSSKYEGLGTKPEAYGRMNKLKINALRYGGDFVALWHNSFLYSNSLRNMYKSVISHWVR